MSDAAQIDKRCRRESRSRNCARLLLLVSTDRDGLSGHGGSFISVPPPDDESLTISDYRNVLLYPRRTSDILGHFTFRNTEVRPARVGGNWSPKMAFSPRQARRQLAAIEPSSV
jgi:hypothetical protein